MLLLQSMVQEDKWSYFGYNQKKEKSGKATLVTYNSYLSISTNTKKKNLNLNATNSCAF
jgi:hypothetical protein